MAITLKAYTDSGLTTEITQQDINQLASGASPDVDAVFYMGDATGKSYQADSNPGVDPVILSIVDATPASGIDVGNIKLALSSVGLDSATAGASLSLGTTVGAATAIYMRSDTPVLAATNTDITLQTNTLVEI